MLHYMEDPDLPMYTQVSSPYNCVELISILMTDDMDDCKTCGTRPLGVSENASFIIDLDRVQFDDLKADDLGSWKQNGSKHTTSGWMIVARYSIVRGLLVAKDTTAFSVDTMCTELVQLSTG